MNRNAILRDFRRAFIQDDTRFDVDEFIAYCEEHDYTNDYAHLKAGFISKKHSDEHFAGQREMQREAEERRKQAEEERLERARQLEEEAKEQARQEYIDAGFSPESFEDDWPAIRASLAAQKIAEYRAGIASPRDYLGGLPGGHSKDITPPAQR